MTDIIETIMEARERAAKIRETTSDSGFPYLVEVLRRVAVTACHVDVTSASALYVTPEGNVLVPGVGPAREATVVPEFDKAALIAAIEAKRARETTFPEFIAAVFGAGVVRYSLCTELRTCTYFGARGEEFVDDPYPKVELPE